MAERFAQGVISKINKLPQGVKERLARITVRALCLGLPPTFAQMSNQASLEGLTNTCNIALIQPSLA